MSTMRLLLLVCALSATTAFSLRAETPAAPPPANTCAPAPLAAGEGPTTEGLATVTDATTMTEEQWRRALTPEQYRILRQKGTEPAFTGKYLKTKTPGVYRCAACGADLFDSQHKFDSGTGWPSFWLPAKPDSVETRTDVSHGMTRTEAVCPRCGSHLGHVFDDGPEPTGLRYCINSLALDLAEKDAATSETKPREDAVEKAP